MDEEKSRTSPSAAAKMSERSIQTPVAPDELIRALDRLRTPIVITHIVPDADALGSMLAVCLAHGNDGQTPKVSLPEGSLSQRLRFLYDMCDVRVAEQDDFKSADGFIVLDTAKKIRCNIPRPLKETDWSEGREIINIDHHATNTQFGELNWVDGSASSTCELVYYLLSATDRRISPVIASLLYAGIQTDTLGFSLPTTTGPALMASAALVEHGADVALLGERLCRSQRQGEFDLLRVVYANTRIVGGGRIAYSTASYDDIYGAGCTAADIDDQITVPRSLEGVDLAMLFTEGHKGKTRINFRGSGEVTVVDLAAEYGGGGHSQAAGAVLDCSLDQAVETVVPRAAEYLQRFPRAR